MNFCTRCASMYEKPGTCNCFAGTQPAIVPTVPIYPQSPTIAPTYPFRTDWIAPYWHGSWAGQSYGAVVTTSGNQGDAHSCNIADCWQCNQT
jgi:hypothetical protein